MQSCYAVKQSDRSCFGEILCPPCVMPQDLLLKVKSIRLVVVGGGVGVSVSEASTVFLR